MHACLHDMVVRMKNILAWGKKNVLGQLNHFQYQYNIKTYLIITTSWLFSSSFPPPIHILLFFTLSSLHVFFFLEELSWQKSYILHSYLLGLTININLRYFIQKFSCNHIDIPDIHDLWCRTAFWDSWRPGDNTPWTWSGSGGSLCTSKIKMWNN